MGAESLIVNTWVALFCTCFFWVLLHIHCANTVSSTAIKIQYRAIDWSSVSANKCSFHQRWWYLFYTVLTLNSALLLVFTALFYIKVILLLNGRSTTGRQVISLQREYCRGWLLKFQTRERPNFHILSKISWLS